MERQRYRGRSNSNAARFIDTVGSEGKGIKMAIYKRGDIYWTGPLLLNTANKAANVAEQGATVVPEQTLLEETFHPEDGRTHGPCHCSSDSSHFSHFISP